MTFDERTWYLILGLFIGYVLGMHTGLVMSRVVDQIQDIKKKVTNMETVLKDTKKDDKGKINLPSLTSFALFLVVAIAFYSAVSTQLTNNDVKSVQKEQDAVTSCLVITLDDTVTALNERTKYSGAQADANIELQKTQEIFLREALRFPPFEEKRTLAAAQTYFKSINKYLTVVAKTDGKREQFPYPKSTDLLSCIDKESKG